MLNQKNFTPPNPLSQKNFIRRRSVVTRCKGCNFEIDFGTILCDFCQADPDAPIPIALTEKGRAALGGE